MSPLDDDFSDAVMRAGYQAQADALAPKEPQEQLLKCNTCGKVTTRMEAETRVFLTGKCGSCGDELSAFVPARFREQHPEEIELEEAKRAHAMLDALGVPHSAEDGLLYSLRGRCELAIKTAVAQARAEQREQEEQGQRGLVMALQELYDVTTYLQGVLTFTHTGVDLLKPEMELASLWLIRVRSDLRRALIPQGKLTHTEASQLNLPSLNDLRSGEATTP